MRGRIDEAGSSADYRAIAPEGRLRMRSTNVLDHNGHGPTKGDESTRASRLTWIALIVTSGPCLSIFFACVTPFAALATLAGLKLGPRDAIVALSVVWLSNQAIGFGLLGYPWTWSAAGWGLAIGASAGLAAMAGRGLSTTGPAPLALSLPFTAAFAVFELGLYVAGFVLPGSEGAFSASVVGHVFVVNAVSLFALVASSNSVALITRLTRHGVPALADPVSIR